MPSNEQQEIEQGKQSRSKMKLYKRVFESRDGQKILADLARFSGVGNESFVPGFPDQTAYTLGMQRVVLRIQSYLAMDDVPLLKLARNYDEVSVNE